LDAERWLNHRKIRNGILPSWGSAHIAIGIARRSDKPD
jgi:hypothetical protein